MEQWRRQERDREGGGEKNEKAREGRGGRQAWREVGGGREGVRQAGRERVAQQTGKWGRDERRYKY